MGALASSCAPGWRGWTHLARAISRHPNELARNGKHIFRVAFHADHDGTKNLYLTPKMARWDMVDFDEFGPFMAMDFFLQL